VFLPSTETAPEPLYRAYSMASPPSSPQRLVIMVRRDPGGVVSPYLCDKLHQGQELTVRGPFGDFRLHESTRKVLFIAGGSGLAPIWSMLSTMRENAQDRVTTLYFSARSKRDLFFLDKFYALQSALPFRFIPVLSDPAAGEAWDGEPGGIATVLNRRLDSLEDHEAYLCGSAGMIDACVNVLKAKGLPDELIFFDKFL